MPRFSVIVPIYNTETYLDKCLDSVIGQSYDDYEVVCVDDGSTDGSADILQRYAAQEPRIRIIRQENHGIGSARNTGLRAAKGDYILFLDSDDWLEADTLQTLVCHTDGNDMVCFGGRRYFNQEQQYEASDPMVAEATTTGWDYYCHHALESRRFAFVCVVLRCYRRQFLLDNGLRFRPGIYHEDNLFTPQACYYAKNVTVIPDALYVYRIRSGSITAHRSLKHKQDILSIANELSHFFIPKDSIDKSIIYRLLTHLYQTAFAESTPEEDRRLLPLVDWPTYRQVSRTKLRHRILFAALRISPCIFRRFLKLLSFKSGRRQEYAPTDIKCPDSLS